MKVSKGQSGFVIQPEAMVAESIGKLEICLEKRIYEPFLQVDPN